MGYLIALIMSFSSPLKTAKRKNGIDVKDAVEDSGSFIYIPTKNDRIHRKVENKIVFFSPKITVKVFLSIALSPSLSGIFASNTIEAYAKINGSIYLIELISKI